MATNTSNEKSDDELYNELYNEFKDDAANPNVKPLTEEELNDEIERQMILLAGNSSRPTTPLMSDEEYNKLLAEYSEGGKTRRHKMRSYKKKHTHKKKRTYRKKSMNKKKRANRTTHRRRH